MSPHDRPRPLHTAVITRRNLLVNVRLPDVPILSTVQPVVFVLLFLYVFGGAIEAALPPAAHGQLRTAPTAADTAYRAPPVR